VEKIETSDALCGRLETAPTLHATAIHTELDQVISPAFQSQMIVNTPVRAEYTLQTCHTPFLTDPDGLAEAIEQAAQ
jgi:hypothetical protein